VFESYELPINFARREVLRAGPSLRFGEGSAFEPGYPELNIYAPIQISVVVGDPS